MLQSCNWSSAKYLLCNFGNICASLGLICKMEDVVTETVAMGLEEFPEGEVLQNSHQERQPAEDSDPS